LRMEWANMLADDDDDDDETVKLYGNAATD
jgi:hypothetical protein